MSKFKQTELMDWIKAEHTDFFGLFYQFLSKDFNYWGVKMINPENNKQEYVWFCSMNESCQAGYILAYINRLIEINELIQPSIDLIKKECFKKIGIL